MKIKNILLTIILTGITYYLAPLIFLHYNSDLTKAGFLLILFFIFISFATNLLIAFFLERNVFVPIITSILSIPLLYTFNTSAVVLIVIITIFSFIGYFLSSIFK